MKTLDLVSRVIILSVLLALVFYAFYGIGPKLLSRFDFNAFYNAIHLIRDGGGNGLYDISRINREAVNSPEGILVYKNPPLTAFIFYPFSFFSLGIAYKIYVVFQLILLIFCAYLVKKLNPVWNSSLILLLLVLFIPTLISVITGQITLILLLIWLMVLYFYRQGNYLLMGIITGLFLLKPQYLLLLPLLLLGSKNKHLFLKGFLISLSIQMVLSVTIVGIPGFLDYLPFLAATESALYTSDPYSQISLSSLLLNISVYLPYLKDLTYFFVTVFYLGGLVFIVRKKPEPMAFIYISMILVLITLPHLWDYDLLLLMPGFYHLAGLIKFNKKTGNKYIVTVCLLIYFCWILRYVAEPYWIAVILIAIFTGSFYVTKNTIPR